jgi:hypothetical protein
MGYSSKIQRVDRGKTQSFYINFPTALAEASNMIKGEEMEWVVEDRNTFVLRRTKPTKSNINNKTKKKLDSLS